jgi:hypothetical protein
MRRALGVRLEAFAIGTSSVNSGTDTFIRDDVCPETRILAEMRIAFAGAVVVDTDGDEDRRRS